MVSHHSASEEEQINELKSFIKTYWKLIALILVIGLAIVWGWRYWQSHSSAKLERSSEVFDALVIKLDPTNLDSVNELVAFSESEDNTYGLMASLKAAQFYVENVNDYATAQSILEKAISKTKDNAMLGIIYTRIARLQSQQNQNEQSLQTLARVKGEGWTAAVNDIRGDILVKQGHYDDAIAAYQLALVSQPAPELVANIQMKRNDVLYQKQNQLSATESSSDEQVESEVTE